MATYSYFIVLCEEMSFSKAAERLYISRQYLSKYVKNLEREYGVEFFEDSRKLVLTPAGKIFLETARRINLLENNLTAEMAELRQTKQGTIKFAITDGRYRILFPKLINEFKQSYPNVSVFARSDLYQQPEDLLLNNEIDFAIINGRPHRTSLFDISTLLNETLYMIISDNLLEQYFPGSYPSCKERFSKGAELKEFANVPFILNYSNPNYRTRKMLEAYAEAENYHLNCVLEMTQNDLHIECAAKDIGACFSWSMYAPIAQRMNERGASLNLFPLKGFLRANELCLISRKNKILPKYTKDFIRLIQSKMKQYSDI